MRRTHTVVAVLVTFAFASDAGGQQATQVVQFRVDAVSRMAVSGNPAPLVVSAAIAGDAPTSVSGSTTTYAISTNESNQKIVASLDQSMPSGTNLEVTLAAPSGASSRGVIALLTSGSDVVTGISAVASSALAITYRLSASPAAPIASAARTVTFTIVSGT